MEASAHAGSGWGSIVLFVLFLMLLGAVALIVWRLIRRKNQKNANAGEGRRPMTTLRGYESRRNAPTVTELTRLPAEDGKTNLLKEIIQQQRDGALSKEEFSAAFQDVYKRAAAGDLKATDSILALRKENLRKDLETNDEQGYELDLDMMASSALRATHFTNDPVYADLMVEASVMLADHFWDKEDYGNAAKRYPEALTRVGIYQSLHPNGRYADRAFLNGLYARAALSAQADAFDLSDALPEDSTSEQREPLIDRLLASKKAFELIQPRTANETYYYLVTMRLFKDYPEWRFDNSYFAALCELERGVKDLDRDFVSDLYIKLGEAYENGFGVAPNENKAVQYIKKAADAGDANAEAFYKDLRKEKRAAGVSGGEYAVRSKKSFVFELVVYIVLFLFGVIFPFAVGSFGNNGFTDVIAALLIGWVLAGIPAGWRTLTRITPNVFVFMAIAKWITYFLVKLVLSVIIGWAMLPVRIVKCIKALRA